MRWSDIPFNPPENTLRQFAVLWLAAFGAIAAWQGLAKGRPAAGLALGVFAVSAGVIGLIRPRALRPIFVGWMVLAFPVGWTISNLFMGMIYFGLFLPFGLVFRLIGRDALALKPPAAATTYWKPRQAPAEIRRYFRQF
jgi:hypothetical protein